MVVYNPYTKQSFPSPPKKDLVNSTSTNTAKRPRPTEWNPNDTEESHNKGPNRTNSNIVPTAARKPVLVVSSESTSIAKTMSPSSSSPSSLYAPAIAAPSRNDNNIRHNSASSLPSATQSSIPLVASLPLSNCHHDNPRSLSQPATTSTNVSTNPYLRHQTTTSTRKLLPVGIVTTATDTTVQPRTRPMLSLSQPATSSQPRNPYQSKVESYPVTTNKIFTDNSLKSLSRQQCSNNSNRMTPTSTVQQRVNATTNAASSGSIGTPSLTRTPTLPQHQSSNILLPRSNSTPTPQQPSSSNILVSRTNSITSSSPASLVTARDNIQRLHLTTKQSSTTYTNQISKTSVQPTVAALRPPSWAATKQENSSLKQATASAPTTVVGKKGPELPGEATLPKQLQYDPETMKSIDDGNRKDLVQNANLSAPLLNGWALYKHQKRAIIQALVRRRMILALDMGLGKTLIGCVWAKAFKATFENLKIIVVCPVSLKAEWKRTAEKATGLAVEQDPTNSNKKDKSPKVDSWLELSVASWAKVPTAVDRRADHYVVIFDEAHSMQSMEASRTKCALELISPKRCIGVLLLTGTPMKNGKASNLFPLLRAVRHPLGRHQKAYEIHFCAGMEKFMKGRRVWDASGCSNLKQLKRLVAPNMLHLTKEQCLEELPPLTRVTRKVPISSRCQLQYIRAVRELASVDFRDRAGQLKDDQQEAVLGAMQRLRVQCSYAKVQATVELAKGILEEEPAVVIFSSFADVAKQVHQQLANSGWEGELLTGQTPPKKRQGLVDKFQNGLSPVFVCTFGAGGVGLTLTAARTIILLDRPWTPGETRQAEDRVRRIGQTKPVQSIWMSAFDLDSQIDAMIESKVQTTNAVLMKQQQGGCLTAGSTKKISIAKLAESLLFKVNSATTSCASEASYPR